METQHQQPPHNLETQSPAELAPELASYDAASNDVVGGTSEVHQKVDDTNVPVVGQGNMYLYFYVYLPPFE